MVKTELGFKYHWAVADYLQRSARHIASKTDVNHAYAIGKAAMEFALQGKNNIMPIIIRKKDQPYQWTIGHVELSKVANKEHKMPRDYLTPDGFHITDKCRKYLLPLIQGEDYPPFKSGLPQYVKLKNISVPKKLTKKFIIQ